MTHNDIKALNDNDENLLKTLLLLGKSKLKNYILFW